MQRSLVLALGLVVAIAGCSGKSESSGKSGSTSGESSTAASPTGTRAATAGSVTVAALPVYPGATKFASSFMRTITVCAHKVTPIVYRSGDSADKVVGWYVQHMPGALKVQLPGGETGNGTGMTGAFLLNHDGGSSVVVEQMHLGSLEKTAQRFGLADKVIVGLTRYDPALSPEEVQLIEQAGSGNADIKASAKAAFKKRCGSGGFSFGT
ncbi:MAG: hypothetical protein ABI282_00525 [Candidatus Baltobacteraceae bacterium]